MRRLAPGEVQTQGVCVSVCVCVCGCVCVSVCVCVCGCVCVYLFGMSRCTVVCLFVLAQPLRRLAPGEEQMQGVCACVCVCGCVCVFV